MVAGGRTGTTVPEPTLVKEPRLTQLSTAPPVPGVEPGAKTRTHAERSGQENLDHHEEIGPRSGCKQIAAHRAKHVFCADDALLEDISEDHEGRETDQQKRRTVIDQSERQLSGARQ